LASPPDANTSFAASIQIYPFQVAQTNSHKAQACLASQ
jgi:hypothetical protein